MAINMNSTDFVKSLRACARAIRVDHSGFVKNMHMNHTSDIEICRIKLYAMQSYSKQKLKFLFQSLHLIYITNWI